MTCVFLKCTVYMDEMTFWQRPVCVSRRANSTRAVLGLECKHVGSIDNDHMPSLQLNKK